MLTSARGGFSPLGLAPHAPPSEELLARALSGGSEEGGQPLAAWSRRDTLAQGGIQGSLLRVHPPAAGPAPLGPPGGGDFVRSRKSSVVTRESSCSSSSHPGPHNFHWWASLPWLAPAGLLCAWASLGPRALCDRAPALQWGRGPGELGPCDRHPRGSSLQVVGAVSGCGGPTGRSPDARTRDSPKGHRAGAFS